MTLQIWRLSLRTSPDDDSKLFRTERNRLVHDVEPVTWNLVTSSAKCLKWAIAFFRGIRAMNVALATVRATPGSIVLSCSATRWYSAR